MIKKYKHHLEKDGFSRKMSAYSAMAGAFLTMAAPETDAAIVYTDVNPDSVLSQMPSTFELDLNNDGNADFNLNFISTMFTYSGFQYMAQGGSVGLIGNNRFMGSGGSNYAEVLNMGAPISAGQNWYGGPSYSYGLLGASFSSTYSGMTYNYAYGNWLGQTDKYLGLEFEIAGQTYYGWVRLDLSTDGSLLRVKDYAYENVAGASINAGDTGSPVVPADTAQALMISDVAENGNGLDLQVAFNRAVDENTIQEYRIIIVKSADASTFNVSDANAVAMANLTAIAPSGFNIMQSLSATSRDKDGDLITFDVAYRAFVLSIADGVNATSNSLSNPSNEVTLNMPDQPADTVSSLVATDVADNGNGSDLEVSFTKAADEMQIDEYRIMVLKSPDATSFDVVAANVVTDYTAVQPNGADVMQVLDANARDKDGDLITNGQPYKIFVLSVADGVNANVNQLSGESNEITLDNATGISGPDPEARMPLIHSLRNQVNISFPDGPVILNDLQIIDLNGRSVVSVPYLDQEKTISLQSAAEGIYLVTFRMNDQPYRQKVHLSGIQ